MKIARRFEPSDEELIQHYLRNKILNPEPEIPFIPEATIYGEMLNPWEKFFPADEYKYPWHTVLDDMGNVADYDRLFVFSQVTNVGKKNGNNFQKTRKAGDGTWHGNHKKAVNCSNGAHIGYSRMLTFKPLDGQETVGHWTMYEYTINPAAYPELPDTTNWVICKIKRHNGKSSVDGKVVRSSKKNEDSNKKKKRQIIGDEDGRMANDAAPSVNLDNNHDLHQVGESIQSWDLDVDDLEWPQEDDEELNNLLVF